MSSTSKFKIKEIIMIKLKTFKKIKIYMQVEKMN